MKSTDTLTGLYKRRISMLEITIMLLVMSVLLAVVVPTSIKLVTSQRISGTKAEMETIFGAMIGAPERSNYGFVGDLGRLPASLDDLLAAGTYPLSTTKTTYGVSMGWNGPYIQKSPEDLARDAFGRRYRFDPEDRAQIVSAGSDGVFDTSDDIVYPPNEIDVYGTVRIEIPQSGDFIVRLYYTDSGKESFAESRQAPYIFENVHWGPHAVEVLVVTDADPLLVARKLVVLTDKTGIFSISL